MSTAVKVLIAYFLPFIGIPLLLRDNWDKFKKFFIDMWNIIKSVVATNVNFIIGFVNMMIDSINNIIKGFNMVSGLFGMDFSIGEINRINYLEAGYKPPNISIQLDSREIGYRLVQSSR